MTATTTAGQRRSRLAAGVRIGLGTVLTAMFVGQVSDLDGFVRILHDYQLGDGAARVLAGFVFVCAGGLAAVSLLWPRASAPNVAIDVHVSGSWFALLVALIWGALAVQAVARGLAIPNCGCFGVHFGQRLSPWVLVQDAVFVLWAVAVARNSLRQHAPAIT